jgi:HlyD family secretion protein
LAVPNDALMDINGEQAYVLAVRDGKARRVPVRLGLRGLTMTEVVDGVSVGELVLVQGEQVVTDGDRVRVAEEPLPSSAAQPAPAASE